MRNHALLLCVEQNMFKCGVRLVPVFWYKLLENFTAIAIVVSNMYEHRVFLNELRNELLNA